MQIIYNFGISLVKYCQRGKNNDFPTLTYCPQCGALKQLKKHGFYWRNVPFYIHVFHIPICRYLCEECQKTVSLLPSFLLPFFQYPLAFIIRRLKEFFFSEKLKAPYQLVQFYRKRFLKNLNLMLALLRKKGLKSFIPDDSKQKAIKLLEMIGAPAQARNFSQSFYEHFTKSFMAI